MSRLFPSTGSISFSAIAASYLMAASCLLAVSCLLAARVGMAQEDEGGCFYNRTIYPEGAEMCQSGQLMRCEEGAWGTIGLCKKEPMPQPVSDGGDRVLEPEE